MNNLTRMAPATTLGGALAKSLVAKTSPGQLRSVFAYNNAASTVYLQFHDATSLPADTAVPKYPPVPLAAGAYYESDSPRDFLTGIVIAVSTTDTALTISGTNDVFLTVGIA